MPEKYKSKVKHPYSNLSDAVLKGEENLLSGEGKGEGVEGVEGGKEGGTKKDSIEKVWRLATAGGDKFIRVSVLLFLLHPSIPVPTTSIAAVEVGEGHSNYMKTRYIFRDLNK